VWSGKRIKLLSSRDLGRATQRGEAAQHLLHLPSTPVPRRPLPVCIQCRLQTTPSLYQLRSSRRASLSSQQLRSADFICGRPWDMEPVARQFERPGHQQRLLQTFTEDVFLNFQLTCVHSALELFGRCALQIYLITYLLSELSVCLSIRPSVCHTRDPRLKTLFTTTAYTAMYLV